MKTYLWMVAAVLFSGIMNASAVLPSDGTYTGRATVSFTPNLGTGVKTVTVKRSEVVKAVVMANISDPYDHILLVFAPLDSSLFEYYSNNSFPNSKCIGAIRFNSTTGAAEVDFVGGTQLTSTLHGNIPALNVSFTDDIAAVELHGSFISGHQVLTVSLARVK